MYPTTQHDTVSTSASTTTALDASNSAQTTTIVSPVKLHNDSWFDDIELEDKENQAAKHAAATKMEDVHVATKTASSDTNPVVIRQLDDSLAGFHVATPIKLEVNTAAATDGGASPARDRSADRRQIAVEFLDVSNEQKYDRLVADDKIKNPFKRRLSVNSNDDSRSNSPSSMQQQPADAQSPAADANVGAAASSAATAALTAEDIKPPRNQTHSGSGANGQRMKNEPKKTRYEHQSSSLSSSPSGSGGTSSYTANTAGLRARFGNHSSSSSNSHTRSHSNSSRSNNSHSGEPRKRRHSPQQYETCEETLARRQKQIDYGKNTVGYDMYVQQVPKSERTKEHPWTPTKSNKYSRRAWDGLVKVWRKKLHCWDPENQAAAANKAQAVGKNADGDDDDDEDDEDSDDSADDELLLLAEVKKSVGTGKDVVDDDDDDDDDAMLDVKPLET